MQIKLARESSGILASWRIPGISGIGHKARTPNGARCVDAARADHAEVELVPVERSLRRAEVRVLVLRAPNHTDTRQSVYGMMV